MLLLAVCASFSKATDINKTSSILEKWSENGGGRTGLICYSHNLTSWLWNDQEIWQLAAI